MAKIKSKSDGAIILAALYQEAARKEKDDILFAGVDGGCATIGDTKKGEFKGFFNGKTLEFSKKIGNHEDLKKSLCDFLKVASSGGGDFRYSLANGYMGQLDCIIVTLNKKGYKLLGRDLYLKVSIIPKNGVIINWKGEEIGVRDDEYVFLVDFHD